MSQLGQSRQFSPVPVTSGLPRTTDIVRPARHVAKVPKTDYRTLTITRYLQVIGGDLVGEAARVDVPFWSQSAKKMACTPVRLISSLFECLIRLSARLSPTAEPRSVAWIW